MYGHDGRRNYGWRGASSLVIRDVAPHALVVRVAARYLVGTRDDLWPLYRTSRRVRVRDQRCARFQAFALWTLWPEWITAFESRLPRVDVCVAVRPATSAPFADITP